MAESPQPHRTSAAGSRQRIDDEHRRLNELLAALGATRDLDRIAILLAQLRELLVAHFATEEGSDGLHDIVSQHAAHRLPNVQQLFEEHRAMLAELDRLRSEVAVCLTGPVAHLRMGVADLSDELRRHEAVEDSLFGEAFYTDIGGRS